MANAKPPTQNQAGQTHSKLIRLIAIIFLALIVLVGLTILIIWLTIKPKKLVYSIDDASIHNYNLSNTNHLNATYNFILRAYNPNKKVSVYYNKVDIDVLYDDETVSRGTIDPFHQPKRNATRFKLNLASHDVSLTNGIAHDLKAERSSGQVEMVVKLKARIKFKVGAWKSRHYHMKVTCAPIMVHFSSSSKGFQRTTCDVDI
ncbi:putative Late embryogenesis abundant protein [Helianthus annuus]|uniref:Late embryogenesis abundant protein, LEA_2 subgroup n=1 Tax=Helianthus annuus TaxID=4232 RepID=A0A251SRW8_HELAN|nr:uncharacterized protein At1g08160 [Helianthus annuus]KAF5773468.1 putative Late embryogenesis abundant protein, LEA_2 subgroup [Helianthus annuus]KAJ0476951.1 putative Late embryogenesis abundant protein [Helianthus annuus]KAJ0481310.1 putative Late embryogenesis abundant protein [Helianthus annuus]KAJ0497779.1 putative Late embryogenesis abundant protein [Helianthus annuus]KAJ0663782.1 putative Late embryogenesis abundant protein [Helianthus annuus]